jgi:predicted nucleotide-binding protein
MKANQFPHFVKPKDDFIDRLYSIADRAKEYAETIVIGPDVGLAVNMLIDEAEGTFRMFFSTDDYVRSMLKRTRVSIRASELRRDREAENRRVSMEKASKLRQYLLTFLRDQVPHIEEVITDRSVSNPMSSTRSADASSIFIVHGHDEAMKQEVARFVSKLGLREIVLHEQPSQGRHILTKLIEEAECANYAIVLCSPDDQVIVKGTEDTSYRARQNVILELGYFLGRLGPEGMTALIKGDVEMPGDYDGVVYTKMDSDGAWRLAIAKELKARGYDIDLNKLI